jgi:L-aminopeptidase/D-esterase-like protein
VAIYGQDGLALAIRPAHTPFDGDAVFAVSVASDGAPAADPLALATLAPMVMAEAVMRGVRAATALHGVPAAA